MECRLTIEEMWQSLKWSSMMIQIKKSQLSNVPHKLLMEFIKVNTMDGSNANKHLCH